MNGSSPSARAQYGEAIVFTLERVADDVRL